MKKGMQFLAVLAAVVSVLSCNKAASVDDPSTEMVFGVAEDGFAVAEFGTKASVVNFTSLSASGFQASATTGTIGSESLMWNDVHFSNDGSGNYKAGSGGKWWATPNPNYHFYGSNLNLNYASGGCTVNATNPNASGGVDAVCAYLANPTYVTKNTLNFQHIYARLGDVVITAGDGYTISNITVSITPKVSGTYNIRTGFGHSDDTGWSGVTAGSSVNVYSKAVVGTQKNDLYLVPGNYSLTITWTASKGDYTKTFTSTTDPIIFFEKGKVTSLTAKTKYTSSGTVVDGLTGDATEIVFGIAVENWLDANKDMVFPI